MFVSLVSGAAPVHRTMRIVTGKGEAAPKREGWKDWRRQVGQVQVRSTHLFSGLALNTHVRWCPHALCLLHGGGFAGEECVWGLGQCPAGPIPEISVTWN